MKDSLQRLLEQFPIFLDKSKTSNFTLSQTVTNDELKKIRQSIADTIESFHLNKKLLIWKEQTIPSEYTIQFRCYYDDIESVTLIKNNTTIYREKYGYDDHINSFEYSYTGTTSKVIPEATFKIIVTTYDEITEEKGFPENDTILGNEFDHDESLDEIGALHNIPRKTYLTNIPVDLYDSTEPPYNDRGSEDDYHYMNRILEYMVKIHEVHPVVLEIWKLYGIEATMENRERLLVKMFDENYHETLDWFPQAWEHKDSFCNYTTDLGQYFFVTASTKTPLRNRPVTLNFKLKDAFARDIEEDYKVDVYMNDMLVIGDYTNKTYKLTNIPSDADNICRVDCKNTTGTLGTDEFIISVRGCNNADIYVAENGNNRNDGTRAHPLKTIQKAINNTHNDTSLIAMMGGNYDISAYDPVVVKNSCTILGCGLVLVENKDDNVFFKLPAQKSVSLNYLTLQHKGDFAEISEITVTNKNHNGEDAKVLIYDTGAEAVELTRISINVTTPAFIGEEITVTGVLTDKYNAGVEGKTVRVTCPGSTPQNVTTDSNGAYSATLTIERMGSLVVTAKFAGDNNYAPVRITEDIVSSMSIETAFEDYDYVVMDMEYEDNDWNYTYKAVSEIESLSDINGAIMNVDFTNEKNVIFNRFTSTSTEPGITNTELRSLTGMLMGIIYEEYKVKHTNYEVN